MSTENERLKSAALNLRGVMADIEVIEKKMEELNDERKRLEREVLPDLFAEAGIRALQLADGSRITLSTLAEGSLPKGVEQRRLAIEWLVANGFEELIEARSPAHGRAATGSKRCRNTNRLSGIDSAKATFDEGINSKTLGARIRDRVQAGLPTPLMTLGIAVFQRARYTKKTNGDTEFMTDYAAAQRRYDHAKKKDDAARAMLVALLEVTLIVEATGSVDVINRTRAAIAQAEAAGITTE